MVNENIILDDIPGTMIPRSISWRNFSGAQTMYNQAGNRHFTIFLEDDFAAGLAAKGWNVKWTKPNDEYETPRAFLDVTVKFGDFPPKIVRVSSGGKTLMNEDNVGDLDGDEITKADIVIRPYNWEVNGKTGVKAYLKTLYVTVEEDEFAAKYAES